MSHLARFVKDLNALNKMFKQPFVSVDKASDRKAIRDRLENELSPENLCCDGELSGAPLRAKSAYLNGAYQELLAFNDRYTR